MSLVLGYAWFYQMSKQADSRGPDDSPKMQHLQSLEMLLETETDPVPHLIEQLASPDRTIRYYAAMGLSRIGPDAADAVPLLSGMLDDEDPGVRAHAILALGRIRFQMELLIPRLAERLEDADEEVRWNAARALISCGSIAADDVCRVVTRADPRRIEQALITLRHIAGGPEATRDVLRRRISDGKLSATQTEESLELLLALGNVTRDELRAGLASPRPLAQDLALRIALADREEFLPLLPVALIPLTRAPTPGREVDPQNVVDRDVAIRTAANCSAARLLDALSHVGPGAADAIPSIQRLLMDERIHDDLRIRAIRTMVHLGADRVVFLPELQRLLDAPHFSPSFDRFEADGIGTFVREIAPQEIPGVVARAARTIDDKGPDNRKQAFALLREFGSDSMTALPGVAPWPQNGDDCDRQMALKLADMDDGPRGALGYSLQELKKSLMLIEGIDRETVRAGIVWRVALISTASSAGAVRREAVQALGDLLLSGPQVHGKLMAANALGVLGSIDAVPHLTEILARPDEACDHPDPFSERFRFTEYFSPNFVNVDSSRHFPPPSLHEAARAAIRSIEGRRKPFAGSMKARDGDRKPRLGCRTSKLLMRS